MQTVCLYTDWRTFCKKPVVAPGLPGAVAERPAKQPNRRPSPQAGDAVGGALMTEIRARYCRVLTPSITAKKRFRRSIEMATLIEIGRIGRRRVAGTVAAVVAGINLISPGSHCIGIGPALMIVVRLVASRGAMVGLERLFIGRHVALILRLQLSLGLRRAGRCRGGLRRTIGVRGRDTGLGHRGRGEKEQRVHGMIRY